jgi:hypothetical protein
MEKELVISFIMLLVIMFSSIYSLVLIRDCQKIIKKYKKASRKYIKEVVSK